MTFFLEKRNFLKIKKKFEPPLENLSYAPVIYLKFDIYMGCPIEIKKRRSRYRKILLRALKPILETNKIRVEVMHQLNKIRVKVMCQLTSVFFLYRAQCFLFLISNALLDFEPSLHKILI